MLAETLNQRDATQTQKVMYSMYETTFLSREQSKVVHDSDGHSTDSFVIESSDSDIK